MGGRIHLFDSLIKLCYPIFKALWAVLRTCERTNNMDIISKIITFLKEVRLEMKKVNWLTRQQLIKYTLVVIGFMLVMATFFGTLDWGFAALLQKFVLGQ